MVKKFIIMLSRKFSKWYTICYCFFFFGMFVAGAFLPDVLKAAVYPVAFEKREEQGMIESVDTVQVEVAAGRPRDFFLPSHSFSIDGLQITVPASIARQYEEGDWYSYYVYENGDVRIGDRRNYFLWQGVVGILLEGFIFFMAFAFIFTETNEKEIEETKRQKENKKSHRIMNVIFAAMVLVMIVICSRTVYYYIMLLGNGEKREPDGSAVDAVENRMMDGEQTEAEITQESDYSSEAFADPAALGEMVSTAEFIDTYLRCAI